MCEVLSSASDPEELHSLRKRDRPVLEESAQHTHTCYTHGTGGTIRWHATAVCIRHSPMTMKSAAQMSAVSCTSLCHACTRLRTTDRPGSTHGPTYILILRSPCPPPPPPEQGGRPKRGCRKGAQSGRKVSASRQAVTQCSVTTGIPRARAKSTRMERLQQEN
jgi:hypothetical protein